MITVNLLAVLLCGIASMVLGSLWYSPVLFGKTWMKEMGINEKDMKKPDKKSMALTYLVALVGSLITAYVLAHILNFAAADTITKGLQAGFWVWLGFFATKNLGVVLWEGKSVSLYIIHSTYDLVNLAIFSLILVSMPL